MESRAIVLRVLRFDHAQLDPQSTPEGLHILDLLDRHGIEAISEGRWHLLPRFGRELDQDDDQLFAGQRAADVELEASAQRRGQQISWVGGGRHFYQTTRLTWCAVRCECNTGKKTT